jgi:hypothetical protein
MKEFEDLKPMAHLATKFYMFESNVIRQHNSEFLSADPKWRQSPLLRNTGRASENCGWREIRGKQKLVLHQEVCWKASSHRGRTSKRPQICVLSRKKLNIYEKSSRTCPTHWNPRMRGIDWDHVESTLRKRRRVGFVRYRKDKSRNGETTIARERTTKRFHQKFRPCKYSSLILFQNKKNYCLFIIEYRKPYL